MSHMRKWNALAFKRPRIQDAQMETTYRVLTREVLECARVFKGRRDVFRISIDYILELLARFARSPIIDERESETIVTMDTETDTTTA